MQSVSAWDRARNEFFLRYLNFQLTTEEMENWKSQIVISNKEKMGLRKRPYAFVGNGVAMLSSVLSSERAVEVNIQKGTAELAASFAAEFGCEEWGRLAGLRYDVGKYSR